MICVHVALQLLEAMRDHDDVRPVIRRRKRPITRRSDSVASAAVGRSSPQDRDVTNDHASNRDALALSARERVDELADHRRSRRAAWVMKSSGELATSPRG